MSVFTFYLLYRGKCILTCMHYAVVEWGGNGVLTLFIVWERVPTPFCTRLGYIETWLRCC